MADLLEQGSRWLEDQRTKYCTRDVTYVRGAASVQVRATIGRTEFQTDDGEAVRIRFTDRDFLILTNDLVLAGNPTQPERGDKVRETQGNSAFVFEVMNWRYSDPYRQTLRIETKLVATETI